VRFYPRLLCPKCSSEQYEWVKASGRGKVYSYSVLYRGPTAAFQSQVPYILAIVELEEGPRVMTNIIADPAQVRIGQEVRVVFEEIEEGFKVPKFCIS